MSEPNIISNITQGFNYDVKSLMTSNTPAIPHKGVVHKQETGTKTNQIIYRRDNGVA